jgi:hypothetical protein
MGWDKGTEPILGQLDWRIGILQFQGPYLFLLQKGKWDIENSGKMVLFRASLGGK